MRCADSERAACSRCFSSVYILLTVQLLVAVIWILVDLNQPKAELHHNLDRCRIQRYGLFSDYVPGMVTVPLGEDLHAMERLGPQGQSLAAHLRGKAQRYDMAGIKAALVEVGVELG